MLQVVAKDLDDYSEFVENVLRKLPGILAIRSNTCCVRLRRLTVCLWNN